MRVVVNATPLIALSLVDRLDLLHRLFEEVIVPSAVHEEIIAKDTSQPGVLALRSATWIKVVSLKASLTIEPLLLGLDIGELQVLLLAREVDPDWVLIDERLGRRVAKAMGLTCQGHGWHSSIRLSWRISYQGRSLGSRASVGCGRDSH